MGRTGRKGKHHIPTAIINGFSYHFNFIIGRIRSIPLTKFGYADVITLDEINAPTCIKLENRIVIILAP